MARAGAQLAGVGAVIAVASGKGGVGKSTVAVNLAFALAAAGARVGLLDADVQGPSLPLMAAPVSVAVTKAADGSSISALRAAADPRVVMMSYGWVAPRNARGERGGGAMRGPLTASVISQLLRFTAWGAVDVLVLDLPPGTGDAHVTVAQAVPISAAVIVTTPQRLALADVSRGLDMFAALRVPPVALVLNMSRFVAPDTGVVYHPLGDAATSPALRELAGRHGLSPAQMHDMPMDARLSAAGDSGTPFVVAHADTDLARAYSRLAADVVVAAEAHALDADDADEAAAAAASSSAAAAATQPADASAAATAAAASDPLDTSVVAAALPGGASVSLRFSRLRRALLLRTIDATGASEIALPPAAVRRACRCAACVDEATGSLRLRAADVPDSIVPTRLVAQGNYAVALSWSDGHDTGIYTFEQLQALAKGTTAGLKGA